MHELVGGELVVVHDPLFVHVGLEVRRHRRIGRLVDRVVIEAIEQHLFPDDLGRGNREVLAASDPPVEYRHRFLAGERRRCFLLRRRIDGVLRRFGKRWCCRDSEDRGDAQQPTDARDHAQERFAVSIRSAPTIIAPTPAHIGMFTRCCSIMAR